MRVCNYGCQYQQVHSDTPSQKYPFTVPSWLSSLSVHLFNNSPWVKSVVCLQHRCTLITRAAVCKPESFSHIFIFSSTAFITCHRTNQPQSRGIPEVSKITKFENEQDLPWLIVLLNTVLMELHIRRLYSFKAASETDSRTHAPYTHILISYEMKRTIRILSFFWKVVFFFSLCVGELII